MQAAQQEHQAQPGERQALEDAEIAGLQPIVELQVDRVREQTHTGNETEQELRAERAAQ